MQGYIANAIDKNCATNLTLSGNECTSSMNDTPEIINKPVSDGSIEALLPENVQGIHARHYNHCSLGIVYEGGLNEKGIADDTRTEAQKTSMRSLLEELTEAYPEAHIIGHCELPHVAKDCPCFPASKFYADLQPENRD